MSAAPAAAAALTFVWLDDYVALEAAKVIALVASGILLLGS
jgi:hypothetical protein